MARKPRVHVEGGVYHTVLRGNGGQDVFYDEEDYHYFCSLIEDGVKRFRYKVHAFSLLPHMISLVIEVSDIPLSKLMQNLSFRYTRWVNQKQSWEGHLFQGRYQAVLVEPEAYLSELVRYVHTNPLRHEVADNIDDYAWTSHEAYLGNEELAWLETDEVLKQFAKQSSASRRKYASFVEEGLEEEYREDFYSGGSDPRVLGSEQFIRKMMGNKIKVETPPPKLREVIVKVCDDYEVKEDRLKAIGRERHASEARAVVAWLAMQTGAATLTDVGEHFNRDVTTLSRGVRHLTQKAQDSKELQTRLKRCANHFGFKLRI